MGVLDDIKERVQLIAAERSMTEDHAFGFWFLEDIEELSSEDAEDTITGGPWDCGRDAVYYDEENRSLRIYQMKYSESRDYVLTAFSDLQRGLQEELKEHPERFTDLESLTLIVVTKYNADELFAEAQKTQQRRIRGWLSKRDLHDLSKNTHIEVFDLKKFAQLMEKLYGVDVTINYRETPLLSEGSIIGLADARAFVPHIDREELLAFNIRKFLGIRTGSVNAKIKETLENEDLRQAFWTYNNGIVCLCTNFEHVDESSLRFTDFTIVNGAQTVSTIAAFLQENPTLLEDEAIWVVCKTVKVVPTALDTAIKLTQTSNTQTPASGKDLRAVDQVHVRLENWLAELGVTYSYKRGGRNPRGADVVLMKDLAQAYVAYWLKLPNVSFARAGSIFSDDQVYETVFPASEIERLHQTSGKEDQLDFARKLLLPVRLLADVREYLKKRTSEGEDRKWKSLAYHMVYAYGTLLEGYHIDYLSLVLAHHAEIVNGSVEMIFEGFKTLANDRDHSIPKDLKSNIFADALIRSEWLDNYFGKRAKMHVSAIVEKEY